MDDDLAAKVEYLRRRTHQTVTEIVRASIETYYARYRDAGDAAYQMLDQTGFIGCGESSPDFSASYKEELEESSSRKVGG